MSPELRLTLLGGFTIILDNQPVVGLTSHKAQALLCYLAVSGRAFSRPFLAGLLWPDVPEANARMNLRKELARLNEVLRPYLLINRESVALDPIVNWRLDVKEFEALLDAPPHQQPSIEDLTAAVALYQGDFLEGFYVLNSPTLEEWLLRQRGRLRERALQALQTLADAYTQQAHHGQAITTLQQLLALEPWREEAHGQLMRLYAQGGQRGLALAQYETCRRVLRSELDVDPAPETVTLALAIQQGAFAGGVGHPSAPPQADDAQGDAITLMPPPFLTLAHRRQLAVAPFVAREGQLRILQRFLDQALGGEGQIVLVTGEAGSGKTALIQEFIRRSLAHYPDLVPVSGRCNAYNGVGDPFLPFRETVGRLTGDIETQWLTGAMTRDHALRLWRLFPAAVQMLTESGAELLDTFIPSAALLRRVETYTAGATTLVRRLQTLQPSASSVPQGQHPEQSRLFAACSDFLIGLAAHQPLLLVLEDLHWADLSSVTLLFHLVRRLRTESAGARLLLVGAYRPEDMATGAGGSPNLTRDAPHPLTNLIHEFKRDWGDIWLDLDQSATDERRRFLDALVDTEPNKLGTPFRQTLFQQTHGHALFTLELLRAMQVRGDLRQDAAGDWVAGNHLDWQTLPARVEGAIEKRIGLLNPDLHDLLAIACVEGEEFTAQVVARVLDQRERQVLQQLSQTLDKRHRLVRETAELQVGGQRLTRYSFGHALVQQYLYHTLSAGEKRLLHGEVGTALATLYDNEADAIVVQLAQHFVQAEAWPQAFRYLAQAGDKARRSYANQEAIAFYTQALGVSQQIQPPLDPTALLPIYEGRALVQLLLAEYDLAVADYKWMVEAAHTVGNLQKEGEALCQLAYIYWLTFSAANTPHVADYAGRALHLAQQTGDQRILAQSLIHLGAVDQVDGRMTEADEKFAQALAISRRGNHRGALGHSLVFSSMQAYLQGKYQAAILFGQEGVRVFGELNDAFTELRALAFLCQSHWSAGEYSQALALLQTGLRMGRERENTFIIGRLLNTQGWFHRELGDAKGAAVFNQESIALGRTAAISHIEISALVNLGLDYIALEQYEAAHACLQPTLARVQQKGFGAHKWRWTMKLLIGLAEVHYSTGAYEQALTLVDAGLKQARATFSQKYVAQGLALRGKILVACNQMDAAGRDLQTAVAIAEPLHSPTLLYPLVYTLGGWCARAGQEDQAIICYQKAKAAVGQITSAIADATLRAGFWESAPVQQILALLC